MGGRRSEWPGVAASVRQHAETRPSELNYRSMFTRVDVQEVYPMEWDTSWDFVATGGDAFL